MSKAGMILKRFRELVQDGGDGTPTIRVLLADHGDGSFQRLAEGKLIDGRFPKGIRLDQLRCLHTGPRALSDQGPPAEAD